MHLPVVANLSNGQLANLIGGTIEMLVKFIPTLAGKMNVTEAKVGIKFCKFTSISIVPAMMLAN